MILSNVDELSKIIKRNNSNDKIVMGCGCFEIFHIGHLEYLQGAKKQGDVLIVGVNSDKYIEQHKNRIPKFSLEERMKIIDSIKGVDYVFPFYDETFENCLQIIKPNVFAKGVDRKIVLEQEICDKYNILICKIGEEKKASSTDLREYII